jgi:hypothetical protein
MSKAFIKESEADGDDHEHAAEEAEHPRSSESKTTSHRAACSDSKTSDGFWSPRNGGR